MVHVWNKQGNGNATDHENHGVNKFESFGEKGGKNNCYANNNDDFKTHTLKLSGGSKKDMSFSIEVAGFAKADVCTRNFVYLLCRTLLRPKYTPTTVFSYLIVYFSRAYLTLT